MSALTPEERGELADLLAGYALGLDVDDVPAVVALFTAEAAFHTYGRVFTGRDRIGRMFAAAPKGTHLVGAWDARLTDRGYLLRSQLVFFPADRSAHRLAIYDDVVVRQAEGLRFAVREVRFLDSQGVLGLRP